MQFEHNVGFLNVKASGTYTNRQAVKVKKTTSIIAVDRYSDWLRAGWSGDRIPVGGENFRTFPDRPWNPSNLLYSRYRVSFTGVKRPGPGVDHSLSSSPGVKERVDLYL